MLPINYNIVNISQGNSNGTSLVGYVQEDYATLVEVFGKPHYTDPSGDGKVHTEWELRFDVSYEDSWEEDGVAEESHTVTIYDWKEPNADVARTTPKYHWHVGGNTRDAVDLVKKAIAEHYKG